MVTSRVCVGSLSGIEPSQKPYPRGLPHSPALSVPLRWNSHDPVRRVIFVYPFCRSANCDSERLSHLLKVNQILNSDFHQDQILPTAPFCPWGLSGFWHGGISPIPPSTRWKVKGDKKTCPEYFPLTGRRRCNALPPTWPWNL